MCNIWLAFLLASLLVSQIHANGCCNDSTDCCPSSCTSTTYCCQTNTCSQTTNCRTTNCCRTCNSGCRTQSCANQCKQKCCNNEDCNSPTTTTTTPSSNPQTTTESTSTPCPQSSHTSDPKECTKNVNNNTVQATFSINNNITNVETIDIPIKISNENHQSIQIVAVPAPVTSGPGNIVSTTPYFTTVPTERTSTTTTAPTTTDDDSSTPCEPGEKVPVLIPIPYYVPVYRPIPYPYVLPTTGCCNIISPCIYGMYDSCVPYQRVCGQQCEHQEMYAVFNPCQNGCFKRPYAFVRRCQQFSNCQVVVANCNLCNENFYLNYNNYQQCGGCFYTNKLY